MNERAAPLSELSIAEPFPDMSASVQITQRSPRRPLSDWLGFLHSGSPWARLRHFIGSQAGAVLGGLLFSGWAAVVFRVGGAYVSLRSSCGQFLVSTFLTLLDARLMLALFHSCNDRRTGALCAAFGSLAFTYGLVIGVHLLLHTPHIWLTILPGLPPTLGYTFLYSLLLLREHAPATVGHR